MSEYRELKVFYYIIKNPKLQPKYKMNEPFFTKYNLDKDQTHINLNLIKIIMSQEGINIYHIIDYRYFHPSKEGYVKITQNSSYPITSNEIYLQIRIKEPEPTELRYFKKATENLELEIKKLEKIKINIDKAVNHKKIDFYFLYALPMEEKENTYNGRFVISYQLEIAKLVGIYKNSKKNFNTIFESVDFTKLKEVITKKPKILHISCHGRDPNSEEGYALIFEEKGYKKEVNEKNLEDLFKIFKNNENNENILKEIDLVFLSSCHSERAGNLFYKYGVKNVIYIDQNYSVSNNVSIDFATSFYQYLINNKSVKESFYTTKQELKEKEIKKCINTNMKFYCNIHKENEKNTQCVINDKKKIEEIYKDIYDQFLVYCNEEFFQNNKNCLLSTFLGDSKIKIKFNEILNQNISDNKCNLYYECYKGNKYFANCFESFKFKYKSQNEESGDIIIYKDNKKGKFNKNHNVFVVEDKETYKNNFLMLIERRGIVKDIYDKIDNLKINFFVLFGDEGVGKFNFAKSVYIYLFERNIINDFYSIKARSLETLKKDIKCKIYEKKDKKYENEKYIYVIEIDKEIHQQINLVNEILNENSILDKKFFYFILLATKKDKIELGKNQMNIYIKHLKHLSFPKAKQLLFELKCIYEEFDYNHLTEKQLYELTKIVDNSRKEMYPLLKLIKEYHNFEDIKNKLIEKKNEKKFSENQINLFMREINDERIKEIIFILYMMYKGLPNSIIKLFVPEFEKIRLKEKIGKYIYQKNQKIWDISRADITNDIISRYIHDNQREQCLEKCLEIFAKLLHCYFKKIYNNKQKYYFKNIDIEYYNYYFFENDGFWKTFNNEIYEECFKKNQNDSDYINIIQKENIIIEDIKDNIFNLLEINIETIKDLYSKNEKLKEYFEQILIIIPRLYINNETKLKEILNKCENILKINDINKKNLLRISLLYNLLDIKKENNEKIFDDFDNLDKNDAKAYAYFINGVKLDSIIAKYPVQKLINQESEAKYNKLIEQCKIFFEKSNELFQNNNMKIHCYYHLGNLEFVKKNYNEAEKIYNEGKKLIKSNNSFIKGLLLLKLAKTIKNNQDNEIDKKEKFEGVIKEIQDMNDLMFSNEAKELQKEFKDKLLPDIVLLSSNPFISEENFSLNSNIIQASHNNQYYLMDKLYKYWQENLNSGLIIKYNILNEENLREAFSGRGKVLIIQSDDFNENGDILLESNFGKSYSLSKNYFERINKINYDILILCYINSGKCLIKQKKNIKNEQNKNSPKVKDKESSKQKDNEQIIKNNEFQSGNTEIKNEIKEKENRLQDKIKYLITFDEICLDILNDIGNQSYLEYNKLSINFLENFIINITKYDIQNAFTKAKYIFQSSFNDFCRIKTKTLFKYENMNYIKLTTNSDRIKKNEPVIKINTNKEFKLRPYPLLSTYLPKEFSCYSYFTKYSKNIQSIIKLIMEKYEQLYNDITKEKNVLIKLNIYGQSTDNISYENGISLNPKQIVALEIMRFCFRNYKIFNPLLFRYYKEINTYLHDLNKRNNDNLSGLGIIVINVKNKDKHEEPLHGFVYIYISSKEFHDCDDYFEIRN